MIQQSFEEQLEHLVFFHLEAIGVPAREHAPRVFVVGQLVPASTVVGGGEVGHRVAVAVATIGNFHIRTTPEMKTIATIMVYQAVIPWGTDFSLMSSEKRKALRPLSLTQSTWPGDVQG